MDPTQTVDTFIKVLAVLQGGTFVAILAYGYKIVKFFNKIEFKTDLMWDDYRNRNINHYHRRSTDDKGDSDVEG